MRRITATLWVGFWSVLAAYAAAAWWSAYESSPLVRGVGALAAIRRFTFNLDLVVAAAACAAMALRALVRRRRPIELRRAGGVLRARAPVVRIDGRRVAIAAAALVTAIFAPAQVLAWTFPSWFACAGPGTPAAFIVATLAAVAIAASAMAREAEVTVGCDGVLIECFGARSFIPLARVTAVTVRGGALVLAVDGGSLRVHAGASSSALAATLDASRRARAAFEASSFARGDRSVAAWLDALRERTPIAAGYRDATLPDDRLWRVVEDPLACPTARAGAACALAAALDDGGRTRLRAAADSSAHPALGAALRVACEPCVDEDALADALSSIDYARSPAASRVSS